MKIPFALLDPKADDAVIEDFVAALKAKPKPTTPRRSSGDAPSSVVEPTMPPQAPNAKPESR